MITLRPASIGDLELLRYWDAKQHVIDCDPDDDWNWEEELCRDPEWREQLVAELDGEPLAFCKSLIPMPKKLTIGEKSGRIKELLIFG